MEYSNILLDKNIHKNPKLLDNYNFLVMQSSNISEKQHQQSKDETAFFEILRKTAIKKNLPLFYKPIYFYLKKALSITQKSKSI